MTASVVAHPRCGSGLLTQSGPSLGGHVTTGSSTDTEPTPRWVDDQGRLLPTRPCPRPGCTRRIPVHRGPARAAAIRHEIATYVSWCGHQQEVILVPEADGMFSEVPILAEAT